tara:strand:+ start:867 stop:1016 length:150 start_codon:yes stop_codon:yes gene_type:complete
LLKFKAKIFNTFLASSGKRLVGTKLHTKDDNVTMLVKINNNMVIKTPFN